jgi:hypothetical protein
LPFPLVDELDPSVSLDIFREGRSKESYVPVTGVTSGVLRGVGLAGQANNGEVMAGAVEPLAAIDYRGVLTKCVVQPDCVVDGTDQEIRKAGNRNVRLSRVGMGIRIKLI